MRKIFLVEMCCGRPAGPGQATGVPCGSRTELLLLSSPNPSSKAVQSPQTAGTGFWHIPGGSTVLLPWVCCEGTWLSPSLPLGSGTYATQERGHC